MHIAPPPRRRRSSGSVWIEPRHGVPCRVCWRRNGKKQPPSAWFDRRADAIAVRDALRERLAAEAPLLAAGQTLPITEVLARWLAARQHEGAMSATVAHAAGTAIRRIIAQTKWRTVVDITGPSLAQWRAEHPKAGQSRPMRNLKAMLRWCALPETLGQKLNHGLNLKVGQTTMAERPQATHHQVETMLRRAQAAGQGALVHCLLTYPWRPKSFLLLERADLDLERGTMLLRRTKNGKDVRGHLLPATLAILAAYVGERRGRVFLGTTGKPWPIDKAGSSSTFSKWFRKVIAHDLPHVAYDGKRGSMTDLMAAADNDIPTVAALAGVSKQTVLRYLQTNEDKKRAALAKYEKRQGAVRGQIRPRWLQLGQIPQPESADFSVDFNSTKLHQIP